MQPIEIGELIVPLLKALRHFERHAKVKEDGFTFKVPYVYVNHPYFISRNHKKSVLIERHCKLR